MMQALRDWKSSAAGERGELRYRAEDLRRHA